MDGFCSRIPGRFQGAFRDHGADFCPKLVGFQKLRDLPFDPPGFGSMPASD